MTMPALAAALVASSAVTLASITGVSSSDVGEQFARTALTETSRLPGTVDAVSTALDVLPLRPGDRLELPADEVEYKQEFFRPVDESITTSELLHREAVDEDVERWVVQSAAMNRDVVVQIFSGGDRTAPAPHLYLFDGAANPDSSNWLDEGGLRGSLGDKDVTVVLPVGARGSMFADWLHDDPQLGRNGWETFVTEELPPLVDKHLERPDNGRRAIGGLSMGAAGAVRIANTHPELYDGAIGLSGCYSTLDKPGWLSTELTVQGRGGDTANMWGEFGSPEWVAADVNRNPHGVGSLALYLSAASGIVGADDEAEYSTRPAEDTLRGVLLERTTYECTRSLDASLRAHGYSHHTVDYLPEGAHNWSNYAAQLRPGWEAISYAMY